MPKLNPDTKGNKTISSNENIRRESVSSIRDFNASHLRVPWKIIMLGDAGVGKSSLVNLIVKFDLFILIF